MHNQSKRPRDEIEGLPAVQMIAVHNLNMPTAQRAMMSGWIP